MDRHTVEEYRREFVEYFAQNYSYQFIRPVGDGNNGGTALFATPSDGRVVIKFANRADTDTMIQNEKSWLGRFRGLEHFIQRVDLDDGDGAGPAPRPNRHWMAIEYLRNGDLDHVVQRAVDVAPFPNRVLWSFFLCLVRVAVGMARWSTPDKKMGRETLAGASQISNIVHNSYKTPNICVGELTPHDREHRLAPSLKMIDFGRTDKYWNSPFLWMPINADPAHILGVYRNIFDAAWTIQGLAIGSTSSWRGRRETMEVRTRARGRFNSHVKPAFWGAEHVDQELRHLVAECLADQPRDVPSIGTLLTYLESAVRLRDRNDVYDTRRQPMEDDTLIALFWSRVLFEPSDVPAVPLGHLAEAAGLSQS